jgi:tetratricopeptide (TPR) repeat protein
VSGGRALIGALSREVVSNRCSSRNGDRMKNLFRTMTLVVGLLVWQSFAVADMPEPKAKAENPNVIAGHKSIEAKNFKSAVDYLTKAVQEEPKNANAHSMLGYSYRKLGFFDKSMEHYHAALRIDTTHRSAHEYLGELYLDMNQPGNAEKQLVVLKKVCPFVGRCEEYDDLKNAIDTYKTKNK